MPQPLLVSLELFFFFGGGSPTCCGLQRADGCRALIAEGFNYSTSVLTRFGMGALGGWGLSPHSVSPHPQVLGPFGVEGGPRESPRGPQRDLGVPAGVWLSLQEGMCGKPHP